MALLRWFALPTLLLPLGACGLVYSPEPRPDAARVPEMDAFVSDSASEAGQSDQDTGLVDIGAVDTGEGDDVGIDATRDVGVSNPDDATTPSDVFVLPDVDVPDAALSSDGAALDSASIACPVGACMVGQSCVAVGCSAAPVFSCEACVGRHPVCGCNGVTYQSTCDAADHMLASRTVPAPAATHTECYFDEDCPMDTHCVGEDCMHAQPGRCIGGSGCCLNDIECPTKQRCVLHGTGLFGVCTADMRTCHVSDIPLSVASCALGACCQPGTLTQNQFTVQCLP